MTAGTSTSAGSTWAAMARATTLSAFDYLDPATFERERRSIFDRTWQLVARLGSEISCKGMR